MRYDDLPGIAEVVDLLGLERDPKSRSRDTFNVKCPFCNDKKYHMNINTKKNVYRCVLCSGDDKHTGILDLYARVRLGKRHEPGPTGNGKELCDALLKDLGCERGPHDYRNRKKAPPKVRLDAVPSCKIAPDNVLDQAYNALFSFPPFALTKQHHDNLVRRGLSNQLIERNGYRSIPEDFSWIQSCPKMAAIYRKLGLNEEKKNWPRLERTPTDAMIGGLIVADYMQQQGAKLEGVPGAFRIKGRWCFLLEPGMMIPTRNPNGQIVSIQRRTDSGKLRYLTLSSKDLPYGVTEGIARVHFPLGNQGPDAAIDTMLTEGPLKADVASALYGKPSFIMAIQGVNNQKDLPAIFHQIHGMGVTTIYNAFDMDKLCNANVRRPSKALAKKIKDAGMQFVQRCWDSDYAQTKWWELHNLCAEYGIYVQSKSPYVFPQIADMADALDSAHIPHSVKVDENGEEQNDYWTDETKGIDDYLLAKKKRHSWSA